MLPKKPLGVGLLPLVCSSPLVSFVSLAVPVQGKESNLTLKFFKSPGSYNNDRQGSVNGNQPE